jgi:hypothetical protein
MARDRFEGKVAVVTTGQPPVIRAVPEAPDA